MSEKYKIVDSEKPHFVTFTIVQWVDLFTRNEYRQVVIDSLKYCQSHKGLIIYAWCIMTNHLHMIIASREGNNLQDTIRDFRGYTSKCLRKEIEGNRLESRKEWISNIFKNEGSKRKANKNFQLWKRNYHPIELGCDKLFNQKIDYIHQNPVKAGFVYQPEHYVYSSALDYSGCKGLLDVDIEWP